MRLSRGRLPALLALLLLNPIPQAGAQTSKPDPQTTALPPREPMTVMTFNIRYGMANDGENCWALRKDFLFDLVKQ